VEEVGPHPEPAPPEALAAEVDHRLRVGILVTVAGVVLLSLFSPLPFWDAIGIPIYYLLLPALSLAQLPLLRSIRIERIPFYLSTVATILTVGVVGLLLGLRLGGWEALGLTPLPLIPLVLWTLGLTATGVAIIVLLVPLDRRLGADLPDLLAEFLPRTRSEKGMFVGVSLAAGVGEEIAYRGYAFLALQLLGVGPWVAAGISSVAFGFLHAYQGPVGIVRAGSMGLVFAASVLLTGSLLPAIAAHALIDLVAGLVLGPRLMRALVDPSPSR
jgi:membrane protease YdiL (CAAX protease family)